MFRPVVIAAAALLAATSALAQQPPEAGLFISPAGEPFRSQPGEAYPLAAWFAAADADHDGAISPGEFEKDAQRFFGVLDTNHDDKINSSETQHYEKEVAPEIVREIPLLSERNGQAGRPSDNMSPLRALPAGVDNNNRLRPPNRGAGFYALLNEPEPVTAADLDFNSIITRDEFTAAAKRRFSRLDKDPDRLLRMAELPVPPIVTMAAQPEGKPRR